MATAAVQQAPSTTKVGGVSTDDLLDNILGGLDDHGYVENGLQ